MPYAPLVHTPAEVRAWVGEFLVPPGGSVVAELNAAIVGVVSTERRDSCSWILQMAVDPAHVGNGIGSMLLQHVLGACPLPIRLYTFQANAGARRFYERHGFRPIDFSDGQENEERCPDALYELAAAPRARSDP